MDKTWVEYRAENSILRDRIESLERSGLQEVSDFGQLQEALERIAFLEEMVRVVRKHPGSDCPYCKAHLPTHFHTETCELWKVMGGS